MNVIPQPPTLWQESAAEAGSNGTSRRRPTHLDLPSEDAVPTNFSEAPQAALLTESLQPVLDTLHPDGQYSIGHDSYIYFREARPPQAGAKSPDWFYVPGVPPLLDGGFRRSYVLWQEHVAPRVVVELVSSDGEEERDVTPDTGKFWAFEQAIRAEYYAIYDPYRFTLEVFRLVAGRYQSVPADAHGRFPVEPLGVALGLWQGQYRNMTTRWLRWFNPDGVVMPTPQERAADAQLRAERLAAKLRELGLDPDAI
ncbi:MAG: Uma2 family endonuclease [Gemmataceae bacterium]